MAPRAGIALLAVCIGFACPASAGEVSKNPAQAPNGAYRLEAAHSVILFSILHLGLTDYHGRFDRLSGTLNFDGNEPERSHVSVTIGMDSVDTPSARLTEDLKGKTVFDVAQYPEARFEATKISRTAPDRGLITGNLTIRNVTKPVTLDAVFRGTERNPLDDVPVLGFHASATIKRSDFGLTDMVWAPLVGDDVTLTIEAMFQQVGEQE